MMTYPGEILLTKEVEQLVYEKAAHRFLRTHFCEPMFDQDQKLWLEAALRSSNLSKAEAHRAISATLYVILAHDTHEAIDEINDTDRLSREKRELTVLAGDFYSALYYREMADLGMIPLLKALQRGVQKTNAAKANIYQLQAATDKEYLTELIASNSAIMSEFATFFQQSETFIRLAEYTILLKRLIAEQKKFIRSGISVLMKAYEHGYFAGNGARTFADWLSALTNNIKHELVTLHHTSAPLTEALLQRIDQLSKYES